VGRHSLGPLLGFLLTKEFIALNDDYIFSGFGSKKAGYSGSQTTVSLRTQ